MKKMMGHQRIRKNMAFYFLSKGVETLSAIALLSLITRYLGHQSYGEYAFIMNLVFVFVPVVNFGLSNIMIRDIARDKVHSGEYFGAAMMCRTFLIFFCAVSLIIIAYQLPDISMLAVALAVISEFSLAYARLCSDLYISFEKMKYDALLTITNRSLNILGICLIVIYDMGFAAIFACTAGVNISTLILGFGIVRRKLLVPKMTVQLASLKSLLKEALPIAFSSALNEILIRVDVFILKMYRDFSEIGLFDAPLRLVLRIATFSLAFVTSLLPIYSRLAHFSRGDLLYVYEKSFKVLFAFILPVALFMSLFAQRICILLFGDQFRDSTVSLQFLAWVLFIIFIDILVGHMLISLNKQNLIALEFIVVFFLNLVLEMILVPRYGLSGAGLSKLIAFGIGFLMSFYFVRRSLGIISITSVVAKPLLSSLLMTGALYMSREAGLPLLIVLGITVYGGGLWGLRVFSQQEVIKLKEILKTA